MNVVPKSNQPISLNLDLDLELIFVTRGTENPLSATKLICTATPPKTLFMEQKCSTEARYHQTAAKIVLNEKFSILDQAITGHEASTAFN